MNMMNEGASRHVRDLEGRRPPARAAEAGGPEDGRPEAGGPEDGTPEDGTPGGGTPGGGTPGGRDPEAIGRFIERFAGVLHESGVPRMPARVFTALLTADAGWLTSADVAAVLGVSAAAVSGAVRYLLQVGLVTSAGEPGSRRLSYGVPDHVWQLLLRAHIATMARWSTTMADGVGLLGAGSPAGERMAESSRFFDFVTTELPGILARWDEYSAAAGVAGRGPDRPGSRGAGTGRPA
jgi:hypothetical protein